MKWLKTKLRNWINAPEQDCYEKNAIVSATRNIDSTLQLRFGMNRAETGWIMDVTRYDRVRDNNTNALYIINDDEELGESISKIITLELMRSR